MLDNRARSDGGWLRRLRALGLPALSAALLAGGVAGCQGGTPGSANAPGTAPPSVGNDVASTQFTATQLRGALLTSVAGATEETTPEAGTYGSLPGVRDTKTALKGVTITPARCARAATTGLDSGAFNSVPAAVASFRRGARGISEVLLAPPATIAPQALGHKIPAGCAHYHAVAGGRTFSYTVKDERPPSLGLGAREIRVHASGATSTDIWTVIYRVNGFVGAVTLIGSGTTSKQVQEISQLAYARAERTLR
jgi:hypothetical protein